VASWCVCSITTIILSRFHAFVLVLGTVSLTLFGAGTTPRGGAPRDQSKSIKSLESGLALTDRRAGNGARCKRLFYWRAPEGPALLCRSIQQWRLLLKSDRFAGCSGIPTGIFHRCGESVRSLRVAGSAPDE
jgi:hypothetical protein